MEEPHLEAAILIVSDTASQDPSTDKAQTVLVDTFRQADRWQVTETKIVGDDVLAIQRALTGWCDRSDAPNLVVTTGGTGFAIKDHTPEAVNPLLERHATGLVYVGPPARSRAKLLGYMLIRAVMGCLLHLCRSRLVRKSSHIPTQCVFLILSQRCSVL